MVGASAGRKPTSRNPHRPAPHQSLLFPGGPELWRADFREKRESPCPAGVLCRILAPMTERLDELRAALKGRYEIERELGHGGMAFVYLANDVRHQREVAVKVLRPDLAAALGPDRFLREIRIAANLTHPHILPLHDSGEVEGFLYYVMPFIEGQTLRDRIDREGELPVTESVRIIREVVDALAFAHSKGVVHRDIKPDNVMLSGGHAIVADFGVAKAVSEATGRDKLTTVGVALGTPAYMAPEQATADPHVDHRADIYAVGAMAYELLAGRPPFTGATPQSVLAAHVTEQVEPVTKYRDQVSGELQAVIMKCLAKKPADRWQSADEMLPHLESLATSSGGITPAATMPVAALSSRRKLFSPIVMGGVAVLAVIGVFGSKMLDREPFTITTSNITHVTSDPGLEFQPALSPDGSEVAYVVGPIGTPRIVVRSTIDVGSGGESRPGEEVSGLHWFPAWTPDGASLRFVACPFGSGSGCDWKEVGSRGGSVRTVVVPRGSNRYAWSRDGSRVAFAGGPDSIFAYSAEGGEPELLGVQVVDPWAPHSLAWAPDGRLIAYVNGNPEWRYSANVSPASIWILDASGGAPVPVTDEEHLNVSPQWLPDSRHLLFVSDRDGPRGIYVVEVGPEGPRGPPRSVPGSSDPHSISISADGRRLAYSKFTVAQNIWSIPIPRSGSISISDAVPVTTGNQVIEEHGLSPDGSSIVFDGTRRGNADLYRMSLEGGDPQLIVDLPDDAFGPDWSPDGTEIAFYGNARGATSHVWVVSADGGDPMQLTNFPGTFSRDPEWSPDGLQIAFMSQGPEAMGAYDIWTLSRDSVGGTWSAPVQLTDFGCWFPDWAPDGASLVCDAETGFARVSRDGEVLSRYDPSTAGLQNSSSLQFSPDGSRIYFLDIHEDGSRGVWWIPANGGDATKVVAFDGPSLSVPITVALNILTVGPENLYLTIAQYESDIWVMDLEW